MRKPDFRLKALDKDTDVKGSVGAGWLNDDGSISVVLNPWVVLNANKSLVLTLFPIKETDESRTP